MIERLKISFILAPMAIVLVIGAYVYFLWSTERRKSNETPVDAVGMLMRDLVRFHEKRGSFPTNLKELEGIVWEKKDSREFSISNRGFKHRNYYYLYTWGNQHYFTLWAIPTGAFRDDAPTWFLIATPEICRKWKGPALDLNQVRNLITDPSSSQLAVMGLIEQPGVRLK